MPKPEAKSFVIPKQLVWEAYRRVKANRGAAGVDEQSVQDFEVDRKGNLYKIWNRMSSGSYFPPPVRTVKIPKANGGERKLGIPTVSDRIAQTVVKSRLEPAVDPLFHPDSYGYRPGKSALDAVGQARQRCWRNDWIVDLDIKGFFDNIPQDLLIRAVRKHATEKWIVLYIERWLQAVEQSRFLNRPAVVATTSLPQISHWMGPTVLRAAAIARAAEVKPDVVCLDVRMPVMDGVAAAGPLSEKSKVLMLSYSDEQHLVTGAIRNGAAGYLVHGRFEPEELERRILAVARGEMVLSPAVTPAVFDALRRAPGADNDSRQEGLGALTAREREILNLLARGRSNRDIAEELFITNKTVKNHLSRIYEKIGVHSRAEAIALWLGVGDQR